MTEYYKTGHLDYQLAFHCAPALAGLKPANLISLSRKKAGGQWNLERYEARLAEKGIRLFPLLEDGQRTLLLVYREQMLRRYLCRPGCRRFLCRYGYRPGLMRLEEMLEHLSARLRAAAGEFPHEIGVFLGYPMTDILGFIAHKGNACKLAGYWKVYGNPEQAKGTFAAYDAARDFYCGCVLRGETIHTIQYGGCCT